jgi:predicted aspartyl protease
MRNFLIALSFVLAGATAAAAGDACKLTLVGSFDLSPEHGGVTLPVVVDGVPTKMLVDTGGPVTLIGPDAVKQLGLRVLGIYGGEFMDVKGTALTKQVIIPSLQVGTMHISDLHAVILPWWKDPAVMGTLAADFLMHFDVEFDFAGEKMNLFSQDHCPGQVVYWTHDPAAAIPIEIDPHGHVVANVTADGRAVKAILDTGASTSVIREGLARSALGVTPQTPGVVVMGERDGDKIYRYTVKSLALGDIAFANAAITIVPESGSAMRRMFLIGRPELKKLHLFVSYKERMIYATAATAH